jgi:ABC-type sugar transport system substrate-binding protein
MTYQIALLLNIAANSYQRALADEARETARKHGFELLPPSFANGSAMEQGSAALAYSRQKVSACLIYPVVTDMLVNVCQILARGGASVAFLAQPPGEIARVRESNPDVLVTAVVSDQRELGRLQGQQCLRLLPGGGSVVLIEGPAEADIAQERLAGFQEVVGSRLRVQSLYGRWEDQEAERVLTAWLSSPGRKLDVVACQNDAMARGARAALNKAADRLGEPRLRSVPVTGIDAVPSDGQRRVSTGELTATVENPRTSGPAIELLAAFWKQGTRTENQVLKARSLPPLDQIKAIAEP